MTLLPECRMYIIPMLALLFATSTFATPDCLISSSALILSSLPALLALSVGAVAYFADLLFHIVLLMQAYLLRLPLGFTLLRLGVAALRIICSLKFHICSCR